MGILAKRLCKLDLCTFVLSQTCILLWAGLLKMKDGPLWHFSLLIKHCQVLLATLPSESVVKLLLAHVLLLLVDTFKVLSECPGLIA